jgi:hypothetical protein
MAQPELALGTEFIKTLNLNKHEHPSVMLKNKTTKNWTL